jgi:hypothetical protein
LNEPECEQSLSAKSIPIVERSSKSIGREFTATRTLELFPMETCSGESTSYPEAFPVSPPALQASDEDEPTNDGYGPRSLKLFVYFTRAGSWQKTLSDSLASSLTAFSGSAGHFETSVTIRGPSSFPLTTWVRHTSESESGLLPTPAATPYGSNQGGSSGRENQPTRPSLQTMAKRSLWPTPKASKAGEDFAKVSRSSTGISLQTAVQIWPTPTAGDSKASGTRNTSTSRAHFGLSLTDAVRQDGGTGRMFPTPISRDHRSGKASQATHDKNSRPLSEQIGGSLNPTWVEILMGLPRGWTRIGNRAYREWRLTVKAASKGCKDSGTAESASSSKRSGAQS